jgi:hypothetical protein
MVRQALTDNLWGQLQATMKAYGCYQTKNSREVMEAILWKLRTGSLGEIYLKSYAHGRLLITALIAGQIMAYGRIFLAYEKKLIRNGYSSTEAMYGVTNMQVELGLAKIEQLDKAVAEQLEKYIYPVMPMDIRLILKSLGVKSTIVKLQVN